MSLNKSVFRIFSYLLYFNYKSIILKGKYYKSIMR